ncbi:protein-(glutamine-N5) methyltransferase, release factor-specific [Thioalkalivibrio denitrificans]|uniref:Release factor glutamine methyltransferase n=1 Tax=Thioalkalivibrio denitrificans TaxID=108003 RepID=A0A1V3ND24_9GAMM|nr:peptide chain release factor N(5)-glutamine methyltransferase [Thioalkalivibrio denitrificans]OOG22945.1 protein-(glutamine-N5) methyltransferase, release factor-specific [Thioalkalivibrio denitrificans]
MQGNTDTVRGLLAEAPRGDLRREAEILLGHLLGRDRGWLLAHDDEPVPPETAAAFRALHARRMAGEPVAYLTGRRGFWTLELCVTPDVLIPRPETERLVEQALACIPEDARWDVADLGTGSGAIALALASERPACRIVATDANPAALAVARTNAERHGIRNVAFLEGEWWQPLQGRHFHLVVSNPPYVADDDPHLARGDVRFEPRHALAAGEQGLDDLKVIISGAPAHLHPGGMLLLEHGYDQGEAVRRLLREAGFRDVETWQDLAGHERVSGGLWG